MARKVEDLRAFQEAQKLCECVYRFTLSAEFKGHRSLADQLQRSSVSVISNMAEGFQSRTKAQMSRYFNIAIASAAEARAQLYVAQAQHLVSDAESREALSHADSTLRLTKAFVAAIRASGPWKIDPGSP